MKFQAVQVPDIEIIMDHALICLLYEYESWAVTSQWKAHTLRVFENKVMRTVFEYKREETTRGWRKLHNEELRNIS